MKACLPIINYNTLFHINSIGQTKDYLPYIDSYVSRIEYTMGTYGLQK